MAILTKRLRWAIIGAPASGKTYLLSDLIQAFKVMGFEHQALPLDTPHSSFGAFFFETTDKHDGGMRQTEKYACRPENHYGAVLHHPRSLYDIHIDFLNIPGEAFGNDAAHIDMYFKLKDAISAVGKGVFALTRYTNPAGRQRFILEPSQQQLTAHSIQLPLRVKPFCVMQESKRMNYIGSNAIYGELAYDEYRREKTVGITGRQLLDRFFEIEPDSVMMTLRLLWQYLFPALDYDDYFANDIFLFFYPLLYCQKATDIILCDKLYRPKTTGDHAIGDSYPFHSLVAQVSNFIDHEDSIHPNVYMAFRGTDFILRSKEANYKAHIAQLKDKANLRDDLYSLFLQALTDGSGEYLDSDPQDGRTLTGMQLDKHLATRYGSDMANGFWHILVKSESNRLLSRLWRNMRHIRPIRDIYREHKPLPMPPHVYFTSTPIDADFNIYVNDPDDASKFIHHDPDRIRSFHIETACNGVQSMCWGSYQLLADILYQNGLTPWGQQPQSPSLRYLKALQ